MFGNSDVVSYRSEGWGMANLSLFGVGTFLHL